MFDDSVSRITGGILVFDGTVVAAERLVDVIASTVSTLLGPTSSPSVHQIISQVDPITGHGIIFHVCNVANKM